MKLLSLILILLCVSCSLFKKEYNHKTNIDYKLVDFISIKKELYASDSIYFLTDKEVQIIIKEWNNSEFKGIYKYFPNYWVRINFKNDSVRTFRASDELIKEDSDWTYGLSSPELLSSLWENAQVIPPPPKPPILIGFDSINRKAKADYKNGIREYTVLGLVEATEFEIYYSDFMKRNYNITMKANCTPTTLAEYYAESMIYEIENEYGENFMELTRIKAEKEFNKQRK